MKPTALLWGILLSLIIHAAIVLAPSTSRNAQTQECGQIEIGIVQLLPSPCETPAPSPAVKPAAAPTHPLSAKPVERQTKKTVNERYLPPQKKDKAPQQSTAPELQCLPAPDLQASPPAETFSDQDPKSTRSPEAPAVTASITPGAATEKKHSSAISQPPADVPQSEPATKSTPPSYRHSPPPPYPKLALKRRWQGEVWLRVFIGEQGDVLDAWVENSSGYPLLDQAALEGVREWTFHPARIGSQSFKEEVRLPVRFELNRS